MRIIVTADTHLNESNKELPEQLLEACKTADLIIHAGDWKTMSVYQTLSKYADVVGVYGNVDSDDVVEHFPSQQIIEVGGHKIGVVHGHGDKKSTEKRAIDAFREEKVDIIIFGHSHIPLVRCFKDILLLNPGSPTYKRKLSYYSYGVLEIGKELRSEIVFFS